MCCSGLTKCDPTTGGLWLRLNLRYTPSFISFILSRLTEPRQRGAHSHFTIDASYFIAHKHTKHYECYQSFF